jgi:phytoene synthase
VTDLDARVRAADFDRWASSRLVGDATVRADLISLYAFEAELEAIPAKVSQPLLAEMRFTWWLDQMDGVFSGAPRKGHPVLERLSAAVVRAALDRSAFDRLIGAHIDRVHDRSVSPDDLYAAPMRQAVRLLAGPGHDEHVRPVADVWMAYKLNTVPVSVVLRHQANAALRGLPVAAFPAVAHAALRSDREAEALKRLRLVGAALLGRI